MLTANNISSKDIRTSRTLRRFIATPQIPTKNRKVEAISTRLGDTKEIIFTLKLNRYSDNDWIRTNGQLIMTQPHNLPCSAV